VRDGLMTRVAAPVLALALTASSAQTAPPPSLATAVGKLQANDAAGATAMLEAIVRAEPSNGRAWRVLASAYQQGNRLDDAIAAEKKSLDVAPSMPAPLLSLGSLYSLKGDADQAFAWLRRAKATRKIDMTQLESDSSFDSIRKDARFADLLPRREDFADPFVEPVTILREWDGEAPNDQFGWIARNIGDVDGDGVPDVVTSAPTNGAAGKGAGRVYVYSTKGGQLLWKADGAPGAQLGIGIEAAGDTNKDGVPDVVASAPGAGKAFVYSGRDGRVLLTLTAENVSDAFGRHVAGVGDIDGDGYADVIVGAPQNSTVAPGAGRAYVYSGKDGHVVVMLSGAHEGDNFGASVAGYTDRSHGVLVIGAPGAGPGGHGRIFVYRVAADDRAPSHDAPRQTGLSATLAFTFDSDETGAALGGMFVSIPGDVDGDGVPDVYASDWSNNARGQSTGRVYVHSGRDGHRLFAFTGETPGEGLGTSPSVAGDVDGDSHADLIVGAWQYSGAALGGGRAYLYSGKDGRLMKTFTCRTPGDTFGFDAVTLGDVDGDGTIDFLITSGWSGVHGFHSGRVFIVSSGVQSAHATR
jgi:hypothetical protein